MQQPIPSHSREKRRDAPSMVVSLAMAAVAVGAVAVISAVATAPAVVGAFTAGFATAAVVSLVWQRRGDDAYGDDSRGDDDITERSTDRDHRASDDRCLQPAN